MKQRWLVIADKNLVDRVIALSRRRNPELANRITVEIALSTLLESAMKWMLRDEQPKLPLAKEEEAR